MLHRLLLLVGLMAAGLTFPGQSVAQAADACGASIAKPGGGYWSCTLNEPFSGRTLNRAIWTPMETTKSGVTVSGECYVDDPRTVAVRNGSLNLSAVVARPGDTCGSWGHTTYLSGEVTSYGAFTQTYGKYEIRARFPNTPGLQSALWMWHQNDTYGPSWYSGEIDIAEEWSSVPDSVFGTIHYVDASNQPAEQHGNCAVPGSTTAFHAYGLEWGPGSFTYLYDGKVCARITSWSAPPGYTMPVPFNHDFFLALQLAVSNIFGPTAQSQFPASMQVDYVKVWR